MMGMGQFGPELRREREQRGIALESITGITKISERNLLALEEERFDRLPGGVLSKGFVRAYARAVGLDEDDWLGRYMAASGQSGQVQDDDAGWIAFAENVGRARKGDMRPPQKLRWAGVALLLTLLALFSWYVVRVVNEGSVSAGQYRGNMSRQVQLAEMPAAPRFVEKNARRDAVCSTAEHLVLSIRS